MRKLFLVTAVRRLLPRRNLSGTIKILSTAMGLSEIVIKMQVAELDHAEFPHYMLRKSHYMLRTPLNKATNGTCI